MSLPLLGGRIFTEYEELVRAAADSAAKCRRRGGDMLECIAEEVDEVAFDSTYEREQFFSDIAAELGGRPKRRRGQ